MALSVPPAPPSTYFPRDQTLMVSYYMVMMHLSALAGANLGPISRQWKRKRATFGLVLQNFPSHGEVLHHPLRSGAVLQLLAPLPVCAKHSLTADMQSQIWTLSSCCLPGPPRPRQSGRLRTRRTFGERAANVVLALVLESARLSQQPSRAFVSFEQPLSNTQPSSVLFPNCVSHQPVKGDYTLAILQM